MQTLPNTFFRDDENYITILPLKRLARLGHIPDLKTTMHRDNMCNKILEFSQICEENNEFVSNWIDNVAIEGIKDVYLQKIKNNFNIKIICEKAKELLENIVVENESRHLCGNKYSNDLKLVKYDIRKDPAYGNIITLLFCRMIHWYSKDKGSYGDWFPVAVDIFMDYGYIAGRAKPKSMIFDFMENGFDIECANSITPKAEIFRALNYTMNILGLENEEREIAEEDFKSKLYKILIKYTDTPIEIQNELNAKKRIIEDLSNTFKNDVFGIPDSYGEDIYRDLVNMAEKYLSISYPDKSIFIRNREAYPLVIEATDDEESHVEQTAGYEEPLQSKAIFFDNKKMMQKSGWCDCIKMNYVRKNDLYTSNTFKVKATAKRGYCYIKFNEFTLEEDIKHVLFSIISA